MAGARRLAGRQFPVLSGRETVYVGLLLACAAVFLALPWSLEGKALAALHGLCAQQPTHTLYFGDGRLPFDARMTGIYSGFVCAALWFLARGRWRCGGIPAVGIAAALAGFVLLLGLDGLNSFLLDIGRPHLYTPHNVVRLLTGFLTGTTLAVFIWMLVAQVGFQRTAATRRPPLAGWRDLGLLLALEAAVALVILSRWAPLRVPLTLFLLVAAMAVMTGLAFGFVVLLGRREGRARTTRQLAGPAMVAFVVALGVLFVTAGGRFLLEALLGLPTAA